jgi:hypothetical protein
MPLSKNINVMKSLIETCLRKNTNKNFIIVSDEDVQMALKVLKALLDSDKLLLVADADRIAFHFASVMEMDYRLLYDITTAKAIPDSPANVVVLHSGDRTAEQKKRYLELLGYLTSQKNIVIWHIGRWH